MGYRYYVGYFSKDKMGEILKEADRLKGLIGTPKEDEEDENYEYYDVSRYLRHSVESCYEVGKLWNDTSENDLDNLLHSNILYNYSSDEDEFYIIDNKKIFLQMSYIMQKLWIKYLTPLKEALGSKSRTKEQDENIEELLRLLTAEIRICENSSKYVGEIDFPPFNSYQYNYLSSYYYEIHKNFDYDKYVLCIYAY